MKEDNGLCVFLVNLAHSAVRLVSVAGPNTNGSQVRFQPQTGPATIAMAHYSSSHQPQFFICTGDTPWLNGKHVVFGKVTSGMDVVRKMEAMGSELGKPRASVVVADSGAL